MDNRNLSNSHYSQKVVLKIKIIGTAELGRQSYVSILPYMMGKSIFIIVWLMIFISSKVSEDKD